MGYYKDPTGKRHYKKCGCENNDCELDRLNTNVTSSLKSGTHKARVNCKTCGAYIKFASNKDIKFFVYSKGIPFMNEGLINESNMKSMGLKINEPDIKGVWLDGTMSDAHKRRIFEEETYKLSNRPDFRSRKKRE